MRRTSIAIEPHSWGPIRFDLDPLHFYFRFDSCEEGFENDQTRNEHDDGDDQNELGYEPFEPSAVTQ